jgi:hypothetical protein
VSVGTMSAALLAVAVMAAPLAAQAPADTLPLTLEQAVSRALGTNEEVQTARVQQSLAEAQITQTRAAAFPQISGGIVYNRTLASIFDNIQLGPPPTPGEDPPPNPLAGLPFGRANTWSTALSITQPLYTAGRVGTALGIARNVRTAAALQTEEAEAEVALQVRIALQADPATRLVEVEVGFPPEAGLIPGTLATVQVEIAQRTDAVQVPRAAVRDGQVWVVGEDGRAARRSVQVGLQSRDRLEILAGLQPGERVVVEGGALLSDGARVRPADTQE